MDVAAQIVALLATLTDDERAECLATVQESFCLQCGSASLPCYCAACYDV